MVVSVVCACSRVYGIISLFSAWFFPETNGWGPPPFCRLSLWCYFLAFYSCLRRYPHMFCYNIGMAWSSGPYNSHASKVFAGREFEKYTGQQQEVGIFMASVIHSQLLRQEFPTVCMRDTEYLQCQAADIFIQILAKCSQSVCALRKHRVEFASCNVGIKSFP